jgi:hypothetical protein
MKNDEYLELIENHPQLTSEGFGVNMDYANGLSKREYFAQEREGLKRQLANFELCLEWLEKNPQLEGKWNAHYWKDRVQDAYKPDHPEYFYIPRGVFILAALYRAYKVTRMRRSTDAWIKVRKEVLA